MKNKWIFILAFLFHGFWALAQENCKLSYESQVKHVRLSDGTEIGYKEAGKGKTTLLMIHGLGGNLSHWNRNFDDLSQHFRVIAIDLPNYGTSTKKLLDDSEGILLYYSKAIGEFIQKKKLKKVVLVGHSMGGQTAMLTALHYPKKIKGLVLVAPAGIETFSASEAKMLSGFINPEATKKQNETAVRQSFAVNFVTMPAEAGVLIQDRLMMPNCPQFDPYWTGVAQGVNGMLKNTVFQDLEKIKVPTLVVFGDKDGLIPNKYLHPTLTTQGIADLAGEKIKNSRVEMIPEAGHLVMFEKPKEFNRTLTNFINKK